MALPQRRIGSEGSTDRATVDWRVLYDVEDPEAVAAYIAPYPHIPALLTEAFGRIRSVFPDSRPPTLHIEYDPGDGDRWLTLLIPVAPLDKEARDRLHQFDDEWWLDAAPRGEPVIVVDVRRR